MATIQEVNSSIVSGSFTNDQLDSIISAIKFARGQIAQKNRYTMVKGTKVKFVSTRTGQTMLGQIVDIKRKFIHVKCGMTTWRVPANMLEVA